MTDPMTDPAPVSHHPTDGRPLRLGILGAAGIAPQAVIRPARRRTDITVSAIASRSRASARSYVAAHAIPVGYDSYDALLADPEIDVVYVALPPSEHARWTIAALEAGKHVLCEKPITMNTVEAAQVDDAARRTGRHVIEAFHDHYHPLSHHLRDLRERAVIGTTTRVTAVFTADNPYFPGSIRHVPELGGGALMDLGCYPVHWVRAYFGTEPTVQSARYLPGPEGADLSIDADLTVDRVSATIHASMVPGVPFDARFTVHGSRGSITVTNLVLPHKGHSVTVVVDDVSATYTVAGRETYDYQLDAVVGALRSGAPAATEGADYVANMTVIDAIYESAGLSRGTPLRL